MPSVPLSPQSILAGTDSGQMRYQCPGESYWIDRAVHLGRLATSYAACRACPHRDDHGALPTVHVASVGKTRRQDGAFFDPQEGLTGVYLNEVDARLVRRFSAALGSALAQNSEPDAGLPAVVLAGDGRPLTAELVAAASEGLRLAGCRIVDIGGVTAGCLAWSVAHLEAAGGLLVGNPRGEPHTVGLKAWGPAGSPWSNDDSFELHPAAEIEIARPVRSWGPVERTATEQLYLARFRDSFHALRPLRFLLDTSSLPLAKCVGALTYQSGCQILRPRQTLAAPHPGAPKASPKPAGKTFRERRLAMLSQQVLDASAHFGVWVDGDGDLCQLVDERGRTVRSEQLLLMLARYLVTQCADATFVLEENSLPESASLEVAEKILAAGGRLAYSPADRQSMFWAVARFGARLGGGSSGRFWYAGQPALADALATLNLVLIILSQSDGRLSEVLDAG